MSKPYSVALMNSGAIPPAAVVKAEVAFANAIERALGGEAQVVAVYKAWRDANEGDSPLLTSEVANLAIRWPNAARKAEDAGTRDLGHFGEHPYFEVRLAHVPESA